MMDSAKTVLFAACVILAVALFSGCVKSFAYDEDFPSDDYDLLPVPIGKRSSSNPFCRRCRIHRDEWVSCSLCYGRPRGIVPYYGKRSSDENADDDEDAGPLADDSADLKTAMEKRSPGQSFLDARCCGVLGLRECCRRSYGKRGYNTIYFPGEFEKNDKPGREMWKRVFETSFDPQEDAGNRLCSCCDGQLFDLSCCSLACF